ncbi:MAG: argininosuccinate lyase, partial [Catalinimonas sp.]
IALVTTNLPSGYHRDVQMIKEHFLPAFDDARACLRVADLMLQHVRVSENLLADDRYRYLFTVEEVNRAVLAGVPFRDAYRQVGQTVENGTYEPDRRVEHTHVGSLGNLRNDLIQQKMDEVLTAFDFERSLTAERGLLGEG